MEVAEQFKSRCDTPIIVGGTHFSITREEAFTDCFDYVVYGEAEMMLGDFLHGADSCFSYGGNIVAWEIVDVGHAEKAWGGVAGIDKGGGWSTEFVCESIGG